MVLKMLVARKEIYDPSLAEFVDEELPTVSAKDAGYRGGSNPAGTALVRKTLSGGTVMRLTFMRVASDAAMKFFMYDRSGTFDYPYLQAAGAEVLLGQPNAPLHVVKGSFVIGVLGSYASGTKFAAYEGLIHYQGTETR